MCCAKTGASFRDAFPSVNVFITFCQDNSSTSAAFYDRRRQYPSYDAHEFCIELRLSLSLSLSLSLLEKITSNCLGLDISNLSKTIGCLTRRTARLAGQQRKPHSRKTKKLASEVSCRSWRSCKGRRGVFVAWSVLIDENNGHNAIVNWRMEARLQIRIVDIAGLFNVYL